MLLNIGIDVGNSDTKSANTTTPSGYTELEGLPEGVDEYLRFNGRYYVPDEEKRFSYKRDKTVDDNTFILTLFGIAKQMLYRTCSPNGVGVPKNNHEAVQKVLDTYDEINLGVGLPPSDYATLSQKTVQYYYDRFGDGVKFSYKEITVSGQEFDFNIRLNECKCFAQDWAAIVTYNPRDKGFVSEQFKSYYAIDIGGYTVDIVPVMNGRPKGAKSTSIDNGVLVLYARIAKAFKNDFSTDIRPDIIEDVLRGERTILSKKETDRIVEITKKWATDMIRDIANEGVLFKTYPVVFLGGGAIAFKKYIEENSEVVRADYILTPNINAKGYTKLLEVSTMKG